MADLKTASIMEWNGMSSENWPVCHHCRTSAMLFILFKHFRQAAGIVEAVSEYIYIVLSIPNIVKHRLHVGTAPSSRALPGTSDEIP